MARAEYIYDENDCNSTYCIELTPREMQKLQAAATSSQEYRWLSNGIKITAGAVAGYFFSLFTLVMIEEIKKGAPISSLIFGIYVATTGAMAVGCGYSAGASVHEDAALARQKVKKVLVEDFGVCKAEDTSFIQAVYEAARQGKLGTSPDHPNILAIPSGESVISVIFSIENEKPHLTSFSFAQNSEERVAPHSTTQRKGHTLTP